MAVALAELEDETTAEVVVHLAPVSDEAVVLAVVEEVVLVFLAEDGVVEAEEVVDHSPQTSVEEVLGSYELVVVVQAAHGSDEVDEVVTAETGFLEVVEEVVVAAEVEVEVVDHCSHPSGAAIATVAMMAATATENFILMVEGLGF